MPKDKKPSLQYTYDEGIRSSMKLLRNLSVAELYEWALKTEGKTGTCITSTGALSVSSGIKTGRSPTDKRIVREAGIEEDVWWGSVNMPVEPDVFKRHKRRCIDWLNSREQLFVVDTFTGWDPKFRNKVRIVCTRAYHALFIGTMLIRPTEEELKDYGKPDFTIWNAGQYCANIDEPGIKTPCSVQVSFATNTMVIAGTEYAGEMKKGVFTVMMYLLAKAGHLCMHASANEGPSGDVSVFFGLSGTGKTTLSAEPKRKLIGDDEHVWTPDGIFNIEGGCYAKAIGLSATTEPEIYNSIKFGCVLENIVMNKKRQVDYNDISITENTRCAYPLDHIPNCKIPAVGGHPKNIILLTCDAFGVLPPVSRLTPEQAMYQFVSGFTAKVAGTEMGIKEPVPTFSPCFGGPFLVMHPSVYAKQLAEKMSTYNADCWLVNSGWSGGPYGVGKRMSLKITRAILNAIHDGTIGKAGYTKFPGWGFEFPNSVDKIPKGVLNPFTSWKDKKAYTTTINKLAGMFRKNFTKYEKGSSEDIKKANPQNYTPSKM